MGEKACFVAFQAGQDTRNPNFDCFNSGVWALFVHISCCNWQYALTPARYDSEPDLLNLVHRHSAKPTP